MNENKNYIKELLKEFIQSNIKYFLKNKKLSTKELEEIKYQLGSFLYERDVETYDPFFLEIIEIFLKIDILKDSDILEYNILGEELIKLTLDDEKLRI